MSIEEVAARAGVGKTTIYRRWASKEDLIIDAMENLISEVHPPDTGSVRDDLVELLTQMQRVLASSRAGDVFPRMVAEVAAGSALGRAYLQRVIGPRFAMVDSILARGVRRARARPRRVRGARRSRKGAWSRSLEAVLLTPSPPCEQRRSLSPCAAVPARLRRSTLTTRR